MNDIRSVIIAVAGAFFALISPIQDFMLGMLILFVLNFAFGWLAAIFGGEEWSWRKAGMCFVYCFIFSVAQFAARHIMITEISPKRRHYMRINKNTIDILLALDDEKLAS